MQIHKWQISKAGSIDRLKLISDTINAPDENEVQISIKAIGLNFADIFACQGLYSATPKGKFTPGLEFSGIITQIGSNAKSFKIGDRIMGVTRFGSYATHINISSNFIKQIPNDWSFEQGAALIVQGLTAWYGLIELGNLKSGQHVLIQSAAGGVGLQALDIIQKKEAIPIAIIGSSEKSELLQNRTNISSEQIIVRSKSNFKTQIKDVLNQLNLDGYHIALDAVYGDYFKPTYDHLLPMGRHILFGAADMMNKNAKPNMISILYKYLKRSKLDPLNMISENKSLMGFNLIWLFNEIDQLNIILDEYLHSNPQKPLLDQSFNFDSVHQAILRLQSGKSVGKVVLKVD